MDDITTEDLELARAAALAVFSTPEAAAEDKVILMERTPDTMLLDIVTHANRAMFDWVQAQR